MEESTLIQWLIWLGSAAGVIASATLFSRLLEQWQWFKQIAPNARHIVAGVGAIALALAGKAASDYFVANPELLARLEPYVNLAFAAAGYLSTQVAHGMAKVAKEKRLNELNNTVEASARFYARELGLKAPAVVARFPNPPLKPLDDGAQG
jgi:hypothetical protein